MASFSWSTLSVSIADRRQGRGCTFDWHRFNAGADAFLKTGEYIPKALYESIKQNRVALKRPVTTPVGCGFASINVTLRKKFDLFSNFRPIKNLPGLKTKYPGGGKTLTRDMGGTSGTKEFADAVIAAL